MHQTETSTRSAFLGLGYREVPAGALLEIGDELQDARGVFNPLPLAQVGLPVPAHALARRPERAQHSSIYLP